jgi:hypothetical protein
LPQEYGGDAEQQRVHELRARIASAGKVEAMVFFLEDLHVMWASFMGGGWKDVVRCWW